MCGNYSREETIQGRKLYEEIWYVNDIPYLILIMQSGYYFMILFYLMFILRMPSKTEQKIEKTIFFVVQGVS